MCKRDDGSFRRPPERGEGGQNMTDFDYWIEKTYHPENFEPEYDEDEGN